MEPASALWPAQLRGKVASVTDGVSVSFDRTLEAWSAGRRPRSNSTASSSSTFLNISKMITPRPGVSFQSLKPGGHLMIFVPGAAVSVQQAGSTAYGHYRRYTRKNLQNVSLRRFEDRETCTLSTCAVCFPWWLLNTVMGKTSFHAPSLRVYDNMSSRSRAPANLILRPPLGKNLILIARKQTG